VLQNRSDAGGEFTGLAEHRTNARKSARIVAPVIFEAWSWISGPAAQVLAGQPDPSFPFTPLAIKAAHPYPGASGVVPGETVLQPSPEQAAILAARRAEVASVKRV
jgi:hypothetical protein